MAQRSYSRIQGTVNILDVYGVNRDRNAQLKNLTDQRTGVTYTGLSARENFPAFWGYLQAKGWSEAELLNLYEFECAWNDALWSCDTYIGYPAVYTRPGNITQSRAWIQAPDGWYRVAFGCMTGLGRYSGKHAQVYGESTGNNVGSTPGTAIVIDHANWMSARQPERNCVFASAWGSDYGTVGGLAYSEGVIVESLRFVGGMSAKDASFKSYGLTLADPGENSAVRYCMATDFNNAGYVQMGGTPAHFDTCSAFYNQEAGFDLLGTSGLHNTTMVIPSGDNNKAGLIRMKAAPGGVCGGTLTIVGHKNESRSTLQKLIVVEGNAGLLNITMTGCTADFDNVTTPDLIEIGGGSQWQVDVRGLVHSSNVQSLVYNKQTGKRYSGGAPFKPISFVINDEGVKFASRQITESTGGGTTPVACTGWTTGPWSEWSTCVNGQQTRTRTVTATPAGCTGTPPNKPAESETQTCTTTPPPTGTPYDRTGWIASASKYENGNTAAKAIDGSATTVWSSGVAQSVETNYLQLDMLTERTVSKVVVTTGWTGDQPRSYNLGVSNSPTSLPSLKSGTGAATYTITLPAGTKGRYLRLSALKTAGVTNWFTVSDIQVYP